VLVALPDEVVENEINVLGKTEVSVGLLEVRSEADLVLVLVLVLVANVVDEPLELEVLDVATVALSAELEVGLPGVEIIDVELADAVLADVDEATEFDEDVPTTSLAPLTALYTGAPTLDFI
jgi:hypothetical protein